MIFRPPPRQGLLTGLLLILVILGLDFWLGSTIRAAPITVLTFAVNLFLVLTLLPLGWIVFCLLTLLRASYTIGEESLEISWDGAQHDIPLSSIRKVLTGQSQDRFEPPPLHLPGWIAGLGRVHDLGPAHFYSVRADRSSVIIAAGGQVYVISPPHPGDFIRQLESQRPAAAPSGHSPRYSPSGYRTWPFWHDRLAQLLLGIALVGNLALFLFLTARFPSLPPQVALHYDAAGRPDILSPPNALFILPLIGLIALLIDGLLGWLLYQSRAHRNGAYILWTVGVLIQFMVWVGLIGLLST